MDRRRNGPKGFVFRRVLILCLVLTSAMVLLLPGTASARLMVAGPEQALQHTDIIITGTVSERSYGEKQRQVVIKVNEVLKGDLPAQVITLQKTLGPMYGWTGFDFPEAGADVFLLLRSGGQNGYFLAWELNSVALLEKGQVVSLYHGSNIGINDGHWSSDDYASAYNTYYQANRTQPVEQVDTLASAVPEVKAGESSAQPAGLWGSIQGMLNTTAGKVANLGSKFAAWFSGIFPRRN